MAWFDRFLRRYRRIDDWTDLAQGRVELRGEVESLELLHEPLQDDPCVAIEYRAWPPATAIGADGGSFANSRAFQVSARQAADFVLIDTAGRRVRVQVEPGDDVSGLHHELVDRYGVGLRAETDIIAPGARVRVEGRVLERMSVGGSPHRSDPQLGVVAADRVWLQ